MSRLTFLHAADLHLDSPFTGLQQVDDEVATLLCDATFRAFESLVQAALDRRVDFLLVAGDVFDQDERSLRAQIRFRDGLARLALEGIPSYVVHGNHDPMDGWLPSVRFPEGVTVFPCDQVTSRVFTRDGQALARIHGISYPTRAASADFGRGFAREGPEPLQIGLFHCNLGNDPRHEDYAPRSLDELRSANLDYWALGHVHEACIPSHDAPFVAYPGNLQGRHIRETGPRGALLVQTDGPRVVRHETLALDAVRWAASAVDISGLATVDDLQERIQDALDRARDEARHRSLVMRLRLTGRGPLHADLERDLSGLLAQVRESQPRQPGFVWVERLENHTRPEVDLQERATAEDFVGSVLRLAGEVRKRPEDARGWLKDLWSNPRAARHLDTLTSEDLEALMDEAVWLAAERLLEDE